MKVKFKDAHLTKEDKKEIKEALKREKEEFDTHTYYVKVNYMKIKAEWNDGTYYAEIYY
jgi:hypothetical protein